jgi:putative copper export protein
MLGARMLYKTLLFFHILAATIWTGGHLVLSIVVLPKVLRERSAEELLQFEAGYERIGIPALLVQVATGLCLAYMMVPNISLWFNLENPVCRAISAKLALLAITIGFAVDARLRLIPHLTPEKLPALAWHVVPVTVVSVLFVYVGVSIRTGGLF